MLTTEGKPSSYLKLQQNEPQGRCSYKILSFFLGKQAKDMGPIESPHTHRE